VSPYTRIIITITVINLVEITITAITMSKPIVCPIDSTLKVAPYRLETGILKAEQIDKATHSGTGWERAQRR